MRTGVPRIFLIDIDGTLLTGGRTVAGADRLLRLTAGRVVLLSNDAEHTPPQLADRLGRLGLRVPPDRIVLAGTAMLDMVRRENGAARVSLLASPALSIYAREIGLTVVDRDPDLVVLGRDRTFDYAKLTAAANAVRAGAGLVVANPDRAHPGAGGTIVPETGALLAAILACAGPVTPMVVGKPHPALFRHALALLGAEPHEAVMIGDNPETDERGARSLGVQFWDAAAGLDPVLSRLLADTDDRMPPVARKALRR